MADKAKGLLPGLRRRVAELWVQANSTKPEKHVTLRRVVSTYLQYYYNWINDNAKLVSYLHVSKSGGSSLCAAIEHPDECHAPTGHGLMANCWSRVFLDGPHWSSYGHDRIHMLSLGGYRSGSHCDSRVEEFHSSNHTFYMNENFLEGEDGVVLTERPCKASEVAMVTIRDPITRLRSHYGMTYNRTVEKLECELLFSLTPTISNNYLTRSLLGSSVFSFKLPGGLLFEDSVEYGLVDAAKKVLSEFDVILLTETMSSDAVLAMMKNALDMKFGAAQNMRRPTLKRSAKTDIGHARASKKQYPMVCNLTKGFVTPVIEKWMGFDLQLYNYGATLAALDQIFWTDIFSHFTYYEQVDPQTLGAGKSCHQALRKCGFVCNSDQYKDKR